MSDGRLRTPALPRVSARDEDTTDLRSPPTEKRTARGASTVRTAATAQTLPADLATVTIIQGVTAGQVFTIERESAVVGRDPDADITIDDPAVSRRHCRFRLSDDRVFIEDLGSANGTFVAGRRLRELQLFELFAGDRVQIGPDVVLRFALSDRVEEQMQRRLYETATRDAVSGAYTRSYLLERLAIEAESARRHRIDLSVLVIGIDKYAETTARIGGRAGARFVRAVAGRLHATLRVEDVLGRFGSDRFAVLVRACDAAGVTLIAERLREATREFGSTATLSIGVASFSELSNAALGRELVALAEARLATAMGEGGNRVETKRPGSVVSPNVRLAR